MFGGLELTSLFDGRLVDETWSYDYEANSWAAVESDERPLGRSMHAMVFSVAAGRERATGKRSGTRKTLNGETEFIRMPNGVDEPRFTVSLESTTVGS